MKLPKMKKVRRETKHIKVCGGVDRRADADEGMFDNMLNMTHSGTNVVSARGRRGIMNFGASDVYNMATLDIMRSGSVVSKAFVVYTGSSLLAYYNDGGVFCSHNILRTTNVMTAGQKQVVLSGTRMFFFPDGMCFNLMDMTDSKRLGYLRELQLGSSEGYFYELCLTPCDEFGVDSDEGEYGRLECKCYYLRSDGTKGNFKENTSINASLLKNDAVMITGFSDYTLNGYYNVYDIDKQKHYIIIKCPKSDVNSVGKYVIRRSVPLMDYVIACGDRLWGCRYGVDEDGNSVNTIYASAAGDARNWHRIGTGSDDSWRADVGCAGEFTGAVCYGGRPVFFKEDAIIKVYGTKPSDFSLHQTNAPGVESGSSKSIAAVGSDIYYKSSMGIVRYDGSLPRCVDGALGGERMKNAVAGSLGDCYYVSMENSVGERALYVYNAKSHMWHIEDDPGVREFCRCSPELFMLCEKDGKTDVYSIVGTYNSDAENAGSQEPSPDWMLESRDIGFDVPEHKYVSALTLQMKLDAGATAELQIDYDGENLWHTKKVLRSSGDGTVTVSLRPRRCAYFRLRFKGRGGVSIYSVFCKLEKCSTYQKRRV